MLKVHSDLFFPLALVVCVALWSAVQPYDPLTWFLEALPIILILIVVVAGRKIFPLTPLSYWLLALGSILVFIGAHYTYARMPVFDWIKVEYGLERNHYDRFGHFFQGFVPAIIFRELLLRTSGLKRGAWLSVVVVVLCMAKSEFYELAEWWTVVALGENAHDFLAMQGDEWDAQKDMFLATIGSIISLLLLSRYHDKQLARIEPAAFSQKLKTFLRHRKGK